MSQSIQKSLISLLNAIKVTDNGLNGSETGNKFNGFNGREAIYVPEFLCFYHVGCFRYSHCIILWWAWSVILRAFFVSALGIILHLRGYLNGCRLADGR